MAWDGSKLPNKTAKDVTSQRAVQLYLFTTCLVRRRHTAIYRPNVAQGLSTTMGFFPLWREAEDRSRPYADF